MKFLILLSLILISSVFVIGFDSFSNIDAQSSGVSITSAYITNQQGQPVSTLVQKSMGFVTVQVNSQINQDALITVGLSDTSLSPLGVGSVKTKLVSGQTELQVSFFIPPNSEIGTGSIFANVLTDWPSQKGIPLTSEMKSNAKISLPGTTPRIINTPSMNPTPPISDITPTSNLSKSVTVKTGMGSGVPGCEASNSCYVPYVVSVSTGGTVTWKNVDSAAHTITSGTVTGGPDGIFDSGLFMAGSSFSHTFSTAGTFDYFCMVHPWMLGKVSVGTFVESNDSENSVLIPTQIPSITDLYLDKNSYNLGDEIHVTGKISPAKANQFVKLQLFPNNIESKNVLTNSKGEFKYTFKISPFWEPGKYQIITKSGIAKSTIHFAINDFKTTTHPSESIDSDLDGILDENDSCPYDSETYNGYQDSDGCPDDDNNSSNTSIDSDGDGVNDDYDSCKFEWGSQSNGCPAPKDSDGDGVNDDYDSCKFEWGSQSNGCPAPNDSDGDGVNDDYDSCKFEWGSQSNGCPMPSSLSFETSQSTYSYDGEMRVSGQVQGTLQSQSVFIELSDYSNTVITGAFADVDSNGNFEKIIPLSSDPSKRHQILNNQGNNFNIKVTYRDLIQEKQIQITKDVCGVSTVSLDKTSYSIPSGEIIVSITDPSRNLDSTVSDSFSMFAKTTQHDAIISAYDTVYETGPNTGIFTNDDDPYRIDYLTREAPNTLIIEHEDYCGNVSTATASVTSAALGLGSTSSGHGGDADGDGTIDGQDGCPLDPNKTSPGTSGCGNVDVVDSDGDGVPDGTDQCPSDPNKTSPGTSGCGNVDVIDSDNDGVPNTSDDCPYVYGTQSDGCPVPAKPTTIKIINDLPSWPNEHGYERNEIVAVLIGDDESDASNWMNEKLHGPTGVCYMPCDPGDVIMPGSYQTFDVSNLWMFPSSDTEYWIKIQTGTWIFEVPLIGQTHDGTWERRFTPVDNCGSGYVDKWATWKLDVPYGDPDILYASQILPSHHWKGSPFC